MSVALSTLLKPALRRAGVTMRPGIGPSPDQYGEIIPELNRFLGMLNCSALNIFHTRIDTFSLTGATTYTIGPGGNFDIPRPMKIKQAVILSGGVRNPPMHITTDSDEWGRVTQQSVVGEPSALYNDRDEPLSTLYFWPQSGGGEQIEIYSWSAISNSFDAETDLVDLPDGLSDAIVNNLALRAADLYPREAKISANVIREARRSLAAYQSLNGTVPKMVTDAPGPRREWDGGFGGGGIIMGGLSSVAWQLPINAPNGVSTVFVFPFYPREVIYNGVTQVEGYGFVRSGTNGIYLRDDDTATTIVPAIGDDIFGR